VSAGGICFDRQPPYRLRGSCKKHAQYLAQEHLAQKLHVVERIAAAMDVASVSIILGQ
jgi:hypothetical protein